MIPIFLYANFEGKRLKVYTRQKCKLGYWSKSKQRLAGFLKDEKKERITERMDEINALLDSYEAEVKKVYEKGMADMLKNPKFRKTTANYLESGEPVIGKKAAALLKITLEQPESALKWLRDFLATEYDVK